MAKVTTLAQGPRPLNAVKKRKRLALALAIPEREVEPEVRPTDATGQLAGHGEDDSEAGSKKK
jgi:hypothetical protein